MLARKVIEMSVRAIRARVVCDNSILSHLWLTHRVFNERLKDAIAVLMKMRRGELGETADQKRRMAAFAWGVLQLEAQNAYDPLIKAASGSSRNATAKQLLNKISKAATEVIAEEEQKSEGKRDVIMLRDARLRVNRCTEYVDAFGDFVNGWLPLRGIKESVSDLPNTLERKLFEEAVACIRGHLALVENWKKDHKEWVAQKAKWEAEPEHKKYLLLRNAFDQFETEAGGPATKRRERWHKYLDWLRLHPELAAWRGGEAKVHEPSETAQKRIERARPANRAKRQAEEFWKANPELKELDKLHGYYEREFVRRRKTKRNPDGFDHRPTFTLPHPILHPRWFVFNAPQTSPQGYRQLSLPKARSAMGQLQLLLLTGDRSNGAYPREWVTVRFKADPRLADFKPCKVQKAATKGKIKGELRSKDAYIFTDRQLQAERKAQISGVKLMFRYRPDGAVKAAYLVFTCNVDDERWTQNAKDLKWAETGEIGKKGNKRKKVIVPDGLVACAVDLGIRNLGFGTIARYENGTTTILRSRNIWTAQEEKEGSHPGRWSAGPDLAHIARHKREIRALRQQRGKPVHGETSHVELQDHITHLAEDRFKKGARAVINFALNASQEKSSKEDSIYPRADILILENLASLLPDAERERGINRALINFNRGQLVDRIRQMALDYGLRVSEISPVGTSQVCSKCGKLGRRYSLKYDQENKCKDIAFGPVEKLFACACGYRGNADHNASVNLHRRFLIGESAVKSYLDYLNKSDQERRSVVESVESTLLSGLRALHKVGPPAWNPLDEPF
jgi:Putative transposase DNA-binding domain